jgi:hypothetical protein
LLPPSGLTTTDAEGRYEFVNLPAARYMINVSKAGYVGLELDVPYVGVSI